MKNNFSVFLRMAVIHRFYCTPLKSWRLCCIHDCGFVLLSSCEPMTPLSINIFKHPLCSHWVNWTQISYGDSLAWGNETLFKKGPGHMIKIAAMLMYGKTLKNVLQKADDVGHWALVCSIRDVNLTKLVQMMILGWPLTTLQQSQNLFPNTCQLEKS